MTLSSPDATPVLVAGAGPAGLAAAAELAHHGIACVVVEPRREVSHDRPRAKTTSVRTMEHLRRWGVADDLRAAAHLSPEWSQRVTFCETLTGARVTDIDNAFGLTTGRDERFSESGQQVPQPIVEEVLRRHLQQQTSVDLRLGSRVTGAVSTEAGVLVDIEDDLGVTSQVHARHVLACDGANSTLRRTIGVELEGTSDARTNFNVVFRAPELDTPLGPAVQYWVVGAATPGLIGRLDLDGTWWAILPGIDADEGHSRTRQLIHGLIGADVPLDVVATDTWVARMLVATTFQDGDIYLVGESAHLNPPWGGHGFNTCVGDAVNIAWKIAAVELGWADPQLLQSYDAERRSVCQQTVRSAAHNMESLPGDVANDAEAIRLAKTPEFHSLGLVLGYTYAGSTVIQRGSVAQNPVDTSTYLPSTAPGARLPHHWMADGSSVYDHLGKGMTLLGPVASQPELVDAVRENAAVLGIPLTVVPAPSDYPWADEFLLVRPDQHIAWRTSDPTTIDLSYVVGGSGTKNLQTGTHRDSSDPAVLIATSTVPPHPN